MTNTPTPAPTRMPGLTRPMAGIWLGLIAAELARLDPENAATYAANAKAATAGIDALDAEVAQPADPRQDSLCRSTTPTAISPGISGLTRRRVDRAWRCRGPGGGTAGRVARRIEDGAGALCLSPRST